MKAQIEAALAPLVGEPLSGMFRYAGCQKFEFGVQRPAKNRKGQDITLADWGLVVSCDWRIVGPDGEIVSSVDFGPARERRDEKAKPFYKMLDAHDLTVWPFVQTVEAREDGALHLTLTHGYELFVNPDSPLINVQPCEYEATLDEQWRFMPKDRERSHVVLTAGGIYGLESE